MHTFVLQDWVTIRGQSGGSFSYGLTIVQSAADWLDLPPFQDLFAWVQVSENTGGSISLYLETSPTDDEALFQSMNGTGVAAIQTINASSAQLTVIKLPMLSAAVPLSRYLRWKLVSATSPWDVTMRIVVAANSPGM